MPEIVDRDSGYHYYSVDQFQKMQGILSLKGMGFSLEEIRNLYEDETHIPSIEALEKKIREANGARGICPRIKGASGTKRPSRCCNWVFFVPRADIAGLVATVYPW